MDPTDQGWAATDRDSASDTEGGFIEITQRTATSIGWIIAAPAPWSGERDGFPGLEAWPKMPGCWSISD